MWGRPCSLILLGVLLLSPSAVLFELHEEKEMEEEISPYLGSPCMGQVTNVWPPLFLISCRGFADQPLFGQPLNGLGPWCGAAPVPYFFQGFCCWRRLALVWVALVWVRSLMCGRPCSLSLLGVLLISPCLGSPCMGQVPDAGPPLFHTSFRGFAVKPFCRSTRITYRPLQIFGSYTVCGMFFDHLLKYMTSTFFNFQKVQRVTKYKFSD